MICHNEGLVEGLVIDEEARDQFTRLLPEIQRHVRFRFRHLHRELCEDRTAEAVALAFVMFVRLVADNRTEFAYSTPLSDYAVRQVLAGRQCGTTLNVNDITSRHCQRKTGVHVTSLVQRDRNSGCWQEMVVEDRGAGPADVASTRIDFRDWLATLPPKKRQIAELLATGETPQVVAQRVQLTAGRISQSRRELQMSWNEFQTQVLEAV